MAFIIGSSVGALPTSKFWKSENGTISWIDRNVVMKFCIHIDIEKTYPNDIIIGLGFGELWILKKWTGWQILMKFCVHIDIDKS